MTTARRLARTLGLLAASLAVVALEAAPRLRL